MIRKIPFKEWVESLPNKYEYNNDDLVLLYDSTQNLMRNIKISQLNEVFNGKFNIVTKNSVDGIDIRLRDNDTWTPFIKWDTLENLLFGEVPPVDSVGKNLDVYIDYVNPNKPVYKKIYGSWELIANLNDSANGIIEATQEV